MRASISQVLGGRTPGNSSFWVEFVAGRPDARYLASERLETVASRLNLWPGVLGCFLTFSGFLQFLHIFRQFLFQSSRALVNIKIT